MVAPLRTPWWLEEAAAAADGDEASEPLSGPLDADVCVVGGGFTGLWTALAVKERDPSAHVVLLEAERCGAGPSGRNGGFLHGYWASIGRACSVLGERAALDLARAGERIIPAVRALGGEVWLHESGMLSVSTTPAQDRTLDASVAAAAAVGRPEQAVPLDRDALAERIRSASFRRGVFFPECATVQPARLVGVLRRKALEAGVELHERSPVRRVEDLRGARAVVVATNAAATGWRPVRRHVTNFGSYVVLTEPVPELLAEIGWTGGEAVVDGRMFIHYFRTTDDGRVLMGSGSGPIGFGGRLDGRFTLDEPTAARAELGLRRLLPGLAGARVERAWGGPIDVSADHLPFFGTVPGTRIHYGLGYSGNGVGPSWLGGQILASLALEREDEWASLPLVRRPPSLPPEPLKRIGGGLVRAAILAVEEAEEAGRRPSLAARAGAAVPRRLGMRIGTR
ncbi:MAG: FAD-dependent oxidoreductase [Acidobacteriota bacterium]|nr:FAD-dependent oxidoreductase [Acidobacteriota bacterium]